MRVVLLFLLAAGAVDAENGVPVNVVHRTWKPGESRLVKQDVAVEVNGAWNSKTPNRRLFYERRTSHYEVEESALTPKDDVAQALSIHFRRAGHRAERKERAGPLQGKSYRVERLKNGALRITTDAGEAAPAKERALIETRYTHFGTPTISEFLSRQRLRANQEIELPSRLSRRILGHVDSTLKAKTATLRVHGPAKEGRKEIEFSIYVTCRTKTDRLHIVHDVTGTFALDSRHGRIVRLDLKGVGLRRRTVKRDGREQTLTEVLHTQVSLRAR